MKEAEIDKLAQVLWDYHLLKQPLVKSDAIFVLCSLDTRVAEYATKLYLEGYGELIVFSGGAGRLTSNVFKKPEAEVFADIAISLGVPKDKIVIENKSTNTGENIQFTYELLQQQGLSPESLILVQKPYMERRTFATFVKQWPNSETKIIISSPQIEYKNYFDGANPKDLVLNVMVGDLQRIKEYPKLGFQIEQNIPDEVWSAYEKLVAYGYDKHLIS